jgi:transposase-like protein
VTAEVEIVTLNPSEARALTDQIKADVEIVWGHITRAYIERAWSALDYADWDGYCATEFGTSRLRLPREERPEIVSSLRESGLSVRAIAAATGINRETVRQELAGDNKLSPDEDALAEQLIANQPPIIGMDGKPYPRPTPKPRWSAAERDIQRQLKAGETIVVTLRGPHDNLIEWADREGLYMRVDRRSDWGNPFVTPDDGDRDTVINNYEYHYLPHKPSLLDRTNDLRGKALGCWCAPEPCHADVLKRLAES